MTVSVKGLKLMWCWFPGIAGSTGIKGDVGDQGPDGPTGETGAQGIVGSQGIVGGEGKVPNPLDTDNRYNSNVYIVMLMVEWELPDSLEFLNFSEYVFFVLHAQWYLEKIT